MVVFHVGIPLIFIDRQLSTFGHSKLSVFMCSFQLAVLYIAFIQASQLTLDIDFWSITINVIIMFPLGFVLTFVVVLLNQSSAGRDFFQQIEKAMKIDK